MSIEFFHACIHQLNDGPIDTLEDCPVEVLDDVGSSGKADGNQS